MLEYELRKNDNPECVSYLQKLLAGEAEPPTIPKPAPKKWGWKAKQQA